MCVKNNYKTSNIIFIHFSNILNALTESFSFSRIVEPLSTVNDPSLDPSLDTSLDLSMWNYRDSNSSKGLLHNCLDSIIDIDVANYYSGEQNEPTEEEGRIRGDQSMDELCIKNYVLRANQMMHSDMITKDEAYLEICKSCRHLFKEIRECLRDSVSLVLNKDVIMVPILGLKYDRKSSTLKGKNTIKRAYANKHTQTYINEYKCRTNTSMSNKLLVINHTVTYILSKLVVSLIDLESYNEEQLSFTCESLYFKLYEDISKKLWMLPDDMGSYDKDITEYKTEFRKIFMSPKRKIVDASYNCRNLLHTIHRVNFINNVLIQKTKESYLKNKSCILQGETPVNYPFFNFMRVDTYSSNRAKKIYDFCYYNYIFIDGIKIIYKDEYNSVILKKKNNLELFYLRNREYIKNVCAIHIITTISWFLNQINIGMYNKNKNSRELFREKFTPYNIQYIIRSIYNYKSYYKGDVLEMCAESMIHNIKLVDSIIEDYYNTENALITQNITFTDLIKYTELSILKYKLKEAMGRYDENLTTEIAKENALKNQENENISCLMKILSNEMNTQISLLSHSHLRTLMLKNYDRYKDKNEQIFEFKNLYFCTSPGEHFVRKIFATRINYIIRFHR
ncbi:hypothetical protein MKS88_003725 [Plasmodium brasilianum]|uniref:Uncharacterized protein n=1 Tax=Plasmodium brasilianum TaxID=5824 RepID=A0ACB9Y6C5_PLABR|nr:hypothetical protein MKS88_003725 [Plasmodium brasilianum]